MLGLEPELESEYQRAISDLDAVDERLGPDCLTLGEVLKAHFLIANHFYLEGEGLGGLGPRDIGLLHSAIHRQMVSFDGKIKWHDRYDVCATLLYGLIKNHPFHDANKRTAFLSVLYHLHRFGRCPAIDEKNFEDFTVEIADNALGRYARYQDLVKSRDPDPEVKFIAYFLRKNTRVIDKAYYSVTYRELQTILSRHSFGLSNPHGNRIDVVRIETRRQSFFGLFAREQREEIKLGQIGFPRWTAQVGKGALKTVREVTGLTAERGIDSASLFHGLDPMQTLITTYHDPLMRLAQR
ncbi:MAG TPA: type II toxin-antitoxin system death-on-curing family toxin [Stellaceae bacterium]|nr:type II toxin-antitoxin system death-on-curing family toxin [Stellaceae bacterium]